jgi:hypothetical protein
MPRLNDRVEAEGEPLPIVVRAVLVVWNTVVAAACFTLFTWIVHDRRMPGWPDILDRVTHGPIVDLAGDSVAAAIAIDVLLFALFGLIHAGFARRTVHLAISRTGGIAPRQVLRTVFMTVTAVAWLTVVFFWQHTGVLVLDLRPALARIGIAPEQVDTYGPLIPFAFVLLCLGTVARHGVLRFMGIRQLLASPDRTDEMGAFRDEPSASIVARAQAPIAHGLGSESGGAPQRLMTTGMYGVVRHPMYMYLLASVLIRPVLSLDLLIFFIASVLFLTIALPLEEQKLIAVFGDQYRRYQQRTPAFIPLWPTRGQGRSPS